MGDSTLEDEREEKQEPLRWAWLFLLVPEQKEMK